MDTPNVSLCIINYNGIRYLPKTLAAIAPLTGQFQRILMIDNASCDGSVSMVRERYPFISIVEMEQNFGPGIARNVGFRQTDTARVLFIDNDVLLTPQCAEHLGGALDDNPGAAFAMPRVVYDHDRELVQYDGAGAHYAGLMILEHANTPIHRAPQGTRLITSLVTACFLADRARWGSRALFDDSFFYIFEDHELGIRARLLGLDIVSVPSACVYHRDGTVGLSLRETGRYHSIRVHNTILNRWKIIVKLYQARTLAVLLPAFALFELFQLAGVLKKGWFKEWREALRWAVTHRSLLLERRRTFQRMRRCPDRSVLCGGPLPFTKTLNAGAIETMAEGALDLILRAYWQLARRML